MTDRDRNPGAPPAPPGQGPVAGADPDVRIGLARNLTLWHALLYGLGVTIGAGIYVLVGLAVAIAIYLISAMMSPGQRVAPQLESRST